MAEGVLLVVSAPSGCGKTTILKKLMAEISGLEFSVSHTTRQARPGERDGVDYHFVSKEAFI
ncbi:guanylate kinase, partial [Desulfobulbus sp. N3]|nr:guanylate kinase [Desulfobulbus sp. N3]